jgi:catechol 2,3-dioxygenase-like lactoylglutathione lyase family enzyme
MASVSVRYIVDDVDSAVTFYVDHLGFEVVTRPGPGFAMLRRDGLRLFLNSPGGPGGAGQAMPDGRRPEPGGWNRFQLEVDDLAATVDKLRGAGVSFRSGIIEGRGGRQVILDDPAGNAVELFQPASE